MTNPDGYTEIEELTLGCDSQETHEALDDYAETHKSLGDYQLMEPELRESSRR
nr:MAG: hypothetical protein J07AB56_00810 [Candidatus Nanosalinarum sp. J07AB56]